MQLLIIFFLFCFNYKRGSFRSVNPINNKSLLVPIMAWHRTHAPSHYLNRWCTVYWRVCVSLGLGGWARLVHIYVSNLTIISSDNGLLPGRCRAIIWTNTGIWLIGPVDINTNEILIEINSFSFKKMHLKMSSAKRRVVLLGPNVLRANMIPEWHKAQHDPVHIVIYLYKAPISYISNFCSVSFIFSSYTRASSQYTSSSILVSPALSIHMKAFWARLVRTWHVT